MAKGISNIQGRQNSAKFVSWNCKGLNGAVKRGNIMAHLRKLDADIIFLQETHLKNDDRFRLRGRWVEHVFHSSFNFKSRGSAIFIKKNIPFISNKVISDIRGRYVIVVGKLYNTPVVLASIYAPNVDDEQFMSLFLDTLPNLDTHYLIMGGDFNFVSNPSLDRSSSRPIPLSKSAKKLNSFSKSYGVVDPWRFTFPNQRKYSFFSPVHHSYSRIDFFMIDLKLISKVKHCDYEPIVLSDHSPVVLHLLFGNKNNMRTWRLNNNLLMDKNFVERIRDNIQSYLYTNNTTEISKSTLWEAFKAFIRGCIISYSVSIDRRNREQKKRLTDKISAVDCEYLTSPSPDLYKKRISLQTEFQSLSASETINFLKRAKTTFYEHGEKLAKFSLGKLKKKLRHG